MINTIVDLIGFNDPTVHKIHEKYGIFSAKLWNISNIAFRICLFFLILGLTFYSINLFYYNNLEGNFFLVISIILILTAHLLLLIGQFSIVLYQILRRDFLWAIASFFVFFIVFIYKSIKKNEF